MTIKNSLKNFKSTLRKQENDIKEGNNKTWSAEVLYFTVFMEYLQKQYNNVKVSNYYLMYNNTFSYTNIKSYNPIQINEETQKELIKEYSSNTKRFLIIPIGVLVLPYVGHSNVLVIDTHKKEAELFEPYGDIFDYSKMYNRQLLIDKNTYYSDIYNFLLKFDTKLKFFNPTTFIPVKGFQYIEELTCDIKEKIGELSVNTYIGFCFIWTMFYIEQRIKNDNVSRKKLIDSLFNKIYKSKESRYICKLVRNYAAFIISLYNKKSFTERLKLRIQFYKKFYIATIVDLTTYIVMWSMIFKYNK